jgi:hypothetical protein
MYNGIIWDKTYTFLSHDLCLSSHPVAPVTITILPLILLVRVTRRACDKSEWRPYMYFLFLLMCRLIVIRLTRNTLQKGSCNNMDTDFGSWILDAGFCIIALHRLDSTSAACDGFVVISIVVIYGTEYTLLHSSHANNEQCTGHAGYCMRIHHDTELNAV